MAPRSIPFASLSSALNGVLLLAPVYGFLFAAEVTQHDPQRRADVTPAVHANGGACITQGCALLDRVQAEQQALQQTINALS